jgi:hypothetical protein
MITLFGKVALVAAMALGTALIGETEISPVEPGDSSPCSGGNEGSFNCCVWQCMHDSSTGCNGRARCCENVCS